MVRLKVCIFFCQSVTLTLYLCCCLRISVCFPKFRNYWPVKNDSISEQRLVGSTTIVMPVFILF